MAKLAFDLDGVVANFYERLLEIYNERHSPPIKEEDLVMYSFADLFDPPTSTNLIEIFNEPGFFLSLRPLPGALETIYHLLDAGCVIEICTAPPHSSVDNTQIRGNPLAVVEKLDWVAATIPPLQGNVTVTSNKFYMDTDMLIDDHYMNIYHWCKRHPKGIGYLVNQPWNQRLILDGEEHDALPSNAVRGALVDLPKFLESFYCFEREEFAYRLSELDEWK